MCFFLPPKKFQWLPHIITQRPEISGARLHQWSLKVRAQIEVARFFLGCLHPLPSFPFQTSPPPPLPASYKDPWFDLLAPDGAPMKPLISRNYTKGTDPKQNQTSNSAACFLGLLPVLWPSCHGWVHNRTMNLSAFNEGNAGHIHMRVIRSHSPAKRAQPNVRSQPASKSRSGQARAKPRPPVISQAKEKPAVSAQPRVPWCLFVRSLPSATFPQQTSWCKCQVLFVLRGLAAQLGGSSGNLRLSSVKKISAIIYKYVRKIILSSQWPSKMVIYQPIPSQNLCCKGKLALPRLFNRNNVPTKPYMTVKNTNVYDVDPRTHHWVSLWTCPGLRWKDTSLVRMGVLWSMIDSSSNFQYLSPPFSSIFLFFLWSCYEVQHITARASQKQNLSVKRNWMIHL